MLEEALVGFIKEPIDDVVAIRKPVQVLIELVKQFFIGFGPDKDPSLEDVLHQVPRMNELCLVSRTIIDGDNLV